MMKVRKEMIEIDNSIIDSTELLNRVRCNVLNKEINIDECYKTKISNNISVQNYNKVQDSLNLVMRNCRTMNAIWLYSGIEINTKNPIKKFIKRCIRKSVYWILKPYWEQQSQFNGEVTKALEGLIKIQTELIKGIEEK